MPRALLHPFLSLSLIFSPSQWMHREGVVEGEENRCSAGARGGEAIYAAAEAYCPTRRSCRPVPTGSLSWTRKALIPSPRHPFAIAAGRLATRRRCGTSVGHYGASTTISNAIEGGARRQHRRQVSFQGQLRRWRTARSSSSKTAFWNREAHVDGEVGGAEEDNMDDFDYWLKPATCWKIDWLVAIEGERKYGLVEFSYGSDMVSCDHNQSNPVYAVFSPSRWSFHASGVILSGFL
uniref:Uncharacterized protein n=1 Tax=Oryza glumipatula TaxID=40148 RepID=A0A0D9ZXC0_9ORYZ